jgi:hypothetical protein
MIGLAGNRQPSPFLKMVEAKVFTQVFCLLPFIA